MTSPADDIADPSIEALPRYEPDNEPGPIKSLNLPACTYVRAYAAGQNCIVLHADLHIRGTSVAIGYSTRATVGRRAARG